MQVNKLQSLVLFRAVSGDVTFPRSPSEISQLWKPRALFHLFAVLFGVYHSGTRQTSRQGHNGRDDGENGCCSSQEGQDHLSTLLAHRFSRWRSYRQFELVGISGHPSCTHFHPSWRTEL